MKFPPLVNVWMTGRVLHSDNLSKLQGKTIMLISGGCHQSSHVNVASRRHVPESPSGRSVARVCVRVCSRVGVYLERRIDHFLITPGDFQGLHRCFRSWLAN